MNTNHEIASKCAMEYTLEGTIRCTYEEVYEAALSSCEETKEKVIEKSEEWLRNTLEGFFAPGILDYIIEDYKNYMNYPHLKEGDFLPYQLK